MAKKKQEEYIEIDTNELFSTISKGIGGEILDDRDKNQWGHVDTGILGLNFILSGKFVGGGVPGGTVLEGFGGSSSGKCFAKDTVILMYDGTTKKVQDVKVGDKVMGNDSTPRTVLSLARGNEMLYRVSPNSNRHLKRKKIEEFNDEYIVNESHILSLKRFSNEVTHRPLKGFTTSRPTRIRKPLYENSEFHAGGGVFNITVSDYIKQSDKFKKCMRGYRNGVDYKLQETRIDPYFLGIWLGDGSKNEASVTTADKEIIEVIYAEAKVRNMSVRKANKDGNKASTYYINAGVEGQIGLDAFLAYKISERYPETSLKEISKMVSMRTGQAPHVSTICGMKNKVRKWVSEGEECPEIPEFIEKHQITNNHFRNSLLNDLNYYNLINNKHIPHDYMRNSREVRMQVLAGLLDSDGYLEGINEDNVCGYGFINKNKQLAIDVFRLARSLGFYASISWCFKTCKNNGKKGKYYKVGIYGNCDEIPVKLPHKKCSPRRTKRNFLNYEISVSPIEVGDYYGFSVDGNQLFLLGDYTVVHNSLFGTNLLRGCQTANGIAVLLDAERTISKDFAVKASHVDPKKFIVLESDTLENSFNRIHKTIRMVRQEAKVPLERPLVIVYDSIAVSPSEREFAETELDMESVSKEKMKEAGAGSDKPGERAKICSKELRKLPPILAENNCIVFFINQIRSKIGVMYGDPTTTAGGGMALEFYTSMRLKLSSSKHIKDSLGKTIGINVNVKCVKNKCFRPFNELRSLRLLFDRGIDPFGGLLELLLQEGRIEAVKPAGTYKVAEPYAGGQEITFKSSKERNDVPAAILLQCPALVDATEAGEVQYYINMFGGAIIGDGDVIEEDIKNEEE